MKVDYIISGQGLAGSLLAWELLQQGKSILVYDDPNTTKASEVAAGLVNPVVFRRMTKSWNIDELFPFLLETYAKLEQQFNCKLFYSLPIKKVLGEGELEFWKKKREENELQRYIPAGVDYYPHAYVRAPHGIGEVSQSGRVDLNTLIFVIKNYLQEKGLLKSQKIDYSQLVLTDSEVSYQENTAQKIIFCEGHQVSNNPFFKELKFRHTKGEVLRVKPKHYRANFILNKALFLMPEKDGIYRLGATYNWRDLSEKTSKTARAELQHKLSTIFKGEYDVIDHQAGIRPTSHDRRPILGIHPNHKSIAIFNGLGSKGTMLGPYFARQLANHLCGGSDLHPEVNINRYF